MFGQIKFNIVVESTYDKINSYWNSRVFKTKNIPVLAGDDLNMIIMNSIRQICPDKDNYVGKGSRWMLHSVDGIFLCVKDLRIYLFQNVYEIKIYFMYQKVMINTASYGQYFVIM